MKFEIVEFDRDYHTVTNRKIMEFPNKEAADAYCKKKSWAGYDYYAYPYGSLKSNSSKKDGYPVL